MRRFAWPGQAPSIYPPWANWRARIVGWLWCHVLRYDCELCQRCGRPYAHRPGIWWSPDSLWGEVGAAFPVGLTLICPACFDREADRLGIMLRWMPYVAHRRLPDGSWTNDSLDERLAAAAARIMGREGA